MKSKLYYYLFVSGDDDYAALTYRDITSNLKISDLDVFKSINNSTFEEKYPEFSTESIYVQTVRSVCSYKDIKQFINFVQDYDHSKNQDIFYVGEHSEIFGVEYDA